MIWFNIMITIVSSIQHTAEIKVLVNTNAIKACGSEPFGHEMIWEA